MLPGFEYLIKERKLTKDTIRTFHLAYCDYFGNIYADTEFPNLDFSFGKEEYKKFRNSVLFPVCNVYGKMVAISARMLDKNANSKYMNTVYEKRDHLFGLNIAWPYLLKEKSVYVAEGNVDAAMMYQNDLKNSVGMLSSVLGVKQMCLLSRFAKDVYLVPDADKAGAKIIDRVKELLKQNSFDINIHVIELPKGYDPDTYLQEFGKDAFLSLNRYVLYEKGVISVR